MRIVQLSDKYHNDYQAFLLSIEQSLLYYSVPYKSFLEELLGCRSQYWLALEDNQIAGVLPLMEKDGPYGRVVNSLPYYGSNGGVLASSEMARNALCEKYNCLAQEQDVAAATLVTHPLMPLHEASVIYDLTDERIGQFTTLFSKGNAVNALLSRLDSSTRRNIRKAKKSGVKINVDNTAVDFLQAVHKENMVDIAGKAKSEIFFDLFPNYFQADEAFRIYTAEVEGKLVAALLIFYFNKTVEYFTPVTCKEYRNMQPMAGIIFEAMVDAAQRGFRKWNWGGTWLSQDGVYRFKRKWGAEDYRYPYYIKVNNSKLFSCSRENLLESYPDFYVVPFDHLRA